jgi:hypothetical protein
MSAVQEKTQRIDTNTLSSNWELVDPPKYSKQDLEKLYLLGDPLDSLILQSVFGFSDQLRIIDIPEQKTEEKVQ